MQSEHAIFLLKKSFSVPQDCKDEQKVLKMLPAAHPKVISQINAPARAIQLCLQARTVLHSGFRKGLYSQHLCLSIVHLQEGEFTVMA